MNYIIYFSASRWLGKYNSVDSMNSFRWLHYESWPACRSAYGTQAVHGAVRSRLCRERDRVSLQWQRNGLMRQPLGVKVIKR
jgi:hypothetical protein